MCMVAKSPRAALAAAGGVTAPASPENAPRADFVATLIATSNWTDDTENATRPRDINNVEVSNEF